MVQRKMVLLEIHPFFHRTYGRVTLNFFSTSYSRRRGYIDTVILKRDKGPEQIRSRGLNRWSYLVYLQGIILTTGVEIINIQSELLLKSLICFPKSLAKNCIWKVNAELSRFHPSSLVALPTKSVLPKLDFEKKIPPRIQKEVWAGHPKLKSGWIRVMSKSKQQELRPQIFRFFRCFGSNFQSTFSIKLLLMEEIMHHLGYRKP